MNPLVKLVIKAIGTGAKAASLQHQKYKMPGTIKSRDGAATEEIVMQRTCQFRNKKSWLDVPDGVLVVTTHRLAFFRNAWTGRTKELHFPLQHVTKAEPYASWFSRGLEVTASGKSYRFKVLGAAEIVEAMTRSRERLESRGDELNLQDVRRKSGCLGVVFLFLLAGTAMAYLV